ncbi:putative lipoprotein [Caballeronia sordidicola]|uniref:Putative lipoprotein n=1 Tax=Caballeronia sordidicola TaxID=196367 RepID=A0A158HYM5_CABSO|nr:lipoprotein [Caballeronia sordidicola]SAL49267.1 putative lipoprotein [Caballeronia sordidicola]
MQVVFRMSAIVAALAISAGTLLAACGQRGPLYLPATPPIPPRPASMQPLPASSAVAPAAASSVDTGDVPDTSGQALSLSPDENLKPSAPVPASAAAPKAASSGY